MASEWVKQKYIFEVNKIYVCGYCPCWNQEYGCYWGCGNGLSGKKPDDCPLVEAKE